MPTYGYECTVCKDKFEVVQRITDESLSIHENCGGELKRLLYPVGIVFKGSGFYVNDYGRKNTAGGTMPKQEEKIKEGTDSPPASTESKKDTAVTTDSKKETAAPAAMK